MAIETLVSTTLAGCIASGAESYLTYPLEYLKTREQLAIRTKGQQYSIPNFTKVWFKGSNVFAFGNVLKSCVRFYTFNWATKFMAEGRTVSSASAPQIVAAGVITGIAETMIVIPFESIKTTMVEASAIGLGAATGTAPIPGVEGTVGIRRSQGTADARSAQSQDPIVRGKPNKTIRPKAPVNNSAQPNGLYTVKPLHNTTAAVLHMYRERGLRAFVQGFNPTVTRQVANSFIRFTTYNFFRQLLVPGETEDDSPRGLTIGMTTAISGLTALTEAVVTQPIDVIKTRMESTNGIKLYGNSLLCAYRIYSEEGIQRLWAGVLYRGLRIWASGAIMWIAYESANTQLARAMKEYPFRLE